MTGRRRRDQRRALARPVLWCDDVRLPSERPSWSPALTLSTQVAITERVRSSSQTIVEGELLVVAEWWEARARRRHLESTWVDAAGAVAGWA